MSPLHTSNDRVQRGLDIPAQLPPHPLSSQMWHPIFLATHEMLTVYKDTNQSFEAVAAGASGYRLKRSSPTKLLQAIREVHGGGSPLSSSIARKVVASFQKSKQAGPKPTHLSPREEAVLNRCSSLIAQKNGCSCWQPVLPTCYKVCPVTTRS